MSDLRPLRKPAKVTRMTKAQLSAEVKLLEQEVAEWRQGTYESVESEDYNRGLRWEAEMAESKARAAEKEALDWVAAVYWTLCIPAGPLETLRLTRRLEDLEGTLEIARREHDQLQRRIERAIAALRGYGSLLDDAD